MMLENEKSIIFSAHTYQQTPPKVCFATHAGEKRAKELIKYIFFMPSIEERVGFSVRGTLRKEIFSHFHIVCAHRLHVLKTAVLFEELRFSHSARK